MRNRRIVRASLAFAVLLVVAGSSIWLFFARRDSRPEIRNVVLISIDTCRADHLSCYGFDRKTTPNIDAVARDGVRFTRAHSTNPITLPAHSSMLTGTNPPFHGVHDNGNYRLGKSNTTLAELLRDHGLQTAAFVSAFVLDAQFGLGQGFETYDDHVSGKGDQFFINERKAGDTTRQVVNWLDENGRDPFFLFVHYFDPHQRYAPPEPYASIYRADPYTGEIAYTDSCIGQVVDKLKSLNVDDSTLVIITSDHGESLGEHGENSHAYFIYQTTIRVPLIIKIPGGARGTIVDTPATVVDLVPTVLGLMGIPQPPQVQGENLSSCLFGKDRNTDDRSLYCESLYATKFGCSALFGLIHGNWKYIWTKRPELYDLEHDPAETRNLIEAEPDIADDLQMRLRKLVTEQPGTDLTDNKLSPDRESADRLKTLGYVGGEIQSASLTVNFSGEDPKDFIDIFRRLKRAQAMRSAGQLERARVECVDVLSERPGHLRANLILGEILNEERRYADAVSHYSTFVAGVAGTSDNSPAPTSLQLNYDIALAHNQLGYALYHLERFDESAAHCRKAVEIEPDFVEAHINLGNALHSLGRNAEAVGCFKDALRLEPDSVVAHVNWGNSLQALGRYEKAVEHYKKAVDLAPDSVEARINWGNTLQAQGRYGQALAVYEEAVQLAPENAATLNSFAWLLATCPDDSLRDGRRAVEYAQRATQHGGNSNARILGSLAAAYAEVGNFEKAVEWQEKAVELAPEPDKDEFGQRLDLYVSGAPFRAQPVKSSDGR